MSLTVNPIRKRGRFADPTNEWTESEIDRRDRCLLGETVVANLARDGALIAWAKATGRYAHICRPSQWGNPFKIGDGNSRSDVMSQFRDYLKGRIDLRQKLPDLSGRVLACFCFPFACHGDILVEELSLSTGPYEHDGR